MISFIIPFATKNKNLYNWKDTDNSFIILCTLLVIQNINKKCKLDKEIILVDNTNTFPDVKIKNLKIVKGIQHLSEETILNNKDYEKYKIDNFNNHSMWAAMAYNIGLNHAKGDYIILQHNDLFYHNDFFNNLIKLLDTNEYVSVDSKKISLSGYVSNKSIFDNLNIDFRIGHEDGGYLKTPQLGLADAFFFLCKKSFFDDYHVDWDYGDTNHGATIKCLNNEKSFVHLGPYFHNPNFKTEGTHTYQYGGKDFVTHLKGGFSEMKLSFKLYNNDLHMDESNHFIKNLIKSL